MSELENNSLEEVKTEPIIGKFKPKRKFLNFVSSVNGARVRFIRDIAFIDGGKLSGLLDNVIFKVTICDEGTINFEEQKGTNLTDDDMIKRLIADIDATDVTGYAQKFVVNGLKFTDIDGNPCFLEVEHEKPINVLASLFDQEEEKVEVSEKGLSILDMLFSDDDNDLVEENLELSEKDVEIILETVQNPPAPNEALKSANESYMEEQFRKMNERKITELEDRIIEKHKDITRYKSDVKQAESKLKESTEQLEVLETRLETLKPTEEPNGYVFRVSEELKLETGLDESTREIADRIADIMKLKKDVLFDYLTGGYYNIYFGDKNDFDKVELSIEILNKIKSIDPVGKFEPSEIDGRQVIQYRGKLNWHQLTDKMIRKGFEQNIEFDKITGSNSYEQKVDETDDVTTENVTDSDFDEVSNSNSRLTFIGTNVGDYKVVETYSKPTDFVIVGVDYNGRDLEITDDYYSVDLYLNGGPVKLSNWGSSFETEGHVSFMTINRYKQWVKEFDAMNEGGGVEAILVTDFCGDITVGCKTEDGSFSTDFGFGDYILHQVEDGEEVIINLINNSTETGIYHITDHDLNKIVPYVRDIKLKEILGEK